MYDIALKIVEIILQATLAFIAWKALSVWKLEIRGRDKYQRTRDLLEYIKKLRFLVYTNEGSLHQIYLNDIISDKKNFYKDQLVMIAKERCYFTASYIKLFEHINTRSDIFIEKEIRLILDSLKPSTMQKAGEDKHVFTRIELMNATDENERCLNDEVYFLNNNESLTIEEYFKKWEILVKILMEKLMIEYK